MTLFFGDIHNHNALGYGLGSLERSIDIARTHLDFFAFTGHSSWHDMPSMEGAREQNWLAGFEKLRVAWPRVQELATAANRDGEFTSFLGFEWHSSAFGDQCVILPQDRAPLVYPESVEALRKYTVERGGLLIPHHLAYATGHRGVNWDVFESECTPVVEIFSEHGNAEDDRGPLPYFNHSMGGRVSSNTARAALDRGLRFGFVASSDNHRGFPGGFGEGLVGVWSEDLTRQSILEGICSRRTIALTGDRIRLDFAVDGLPMGASMRSGGDVEASIAVDARDEIDVVELIVDGRVARRLAPDIIAPVDINRQRLNKSRTGDGFQVRFEYGWGPWGDMSLDRICDWKFDVAVRGGRLRAVYPCLRSGPFDEDRRHQIVPSVDGSGVSVVSYSGRQGAFRGNPNHSVVLHVDGDAETVFELRMTSPADCMEVVAARQLADSSVPLFTGPFPAESCLWHRLVPAVASQMNVTVRLDLPPGNHYVYPRVRQRNGQMAWASPVFVEVEP